MRECWRSWCYSLHIPYSMYLLKQLVDHTSIAQTSIVETVRNLFSILGKILITNTFWEMFTVKKKKKMSMKPFRNISNSKKCWCLKKKVSWVGAQSASVMFRLLIYDHSILLQGSINYLSIKLKHEPLWLKYSNRMFHVITPMALSKALNVKTTIIWSLWCVLLNRWLKWICTVLLTVWL